VKEIRVLANPDDLIEDHETFGMHLFSLDSHGRMVIFSTGAVALGTFLNDDLFAVDVLDHSQFEGTGPTTDFTLTVTIEDPVDRDVSIELMTWYYTASELGDYVRRPSIIVQIPAGQLSATFVVQVFADDRREGNEKFYVHIVGIYCTTPLETGTRYHDGYPAALVKIVNDDEGPYASSTGVNKVAFYHGGDAGVPPSANGVDFQRSADYYYDDIFNVNSWADLVAQLEAYVAVHGRVDDIAIFDQGLSGIQEVGDNFALSDFFESLAPLLDDDAQVWLLGNEVCQGTTGEDYCDRISDEAAPGARVLAHDGIVQYQSSGAVAPIGGYWEMFTGRKKGIHP